MNRSAAAIGAALIAGGCASALRPLDPESALAVADPALADPQRAAALREQARRAFARRPDIAAVAAAEELWLQAAVAEPTIADDVIEMVRAQVWLVERLPEESARAAKATRAVDTARWCRRREPARPDCHYWLALAVGMQANEHRATAMDGLDVMQRQLRLAIDGNEALEHAGPHRVMARLLLRAPGWPTGPGDADAGLEHARRAVELAADYPPNLLTLGEAYREVGEADASRDAYRRALHAAETWRRRGDPDAVEWIDEAQASLADAPGYPVAPKGNGLLTRAVA